MSHDLSLAVTRLYGRLSRWSSTPLPVSLRNPSGRWIPPPSHINPFVGQRHRGSHSILAKRLAGSTMGAPSTRSVPGTRRCRASPKQPSPAEKIGGSDVLPWPRPSVRDWGKLRDGMDKTRDTRDIQEERMAGRVGGKVAVVVGGGQAPGATIGNGRATAIVLAREGARGCGRRPGSGFGPGHRRHDRGRRWRRRRSSRGRDR